MKSFILIVLFGLLSLYCIKVYAQKYRREGDSFIQVKDKGSKVEPIKTDKVWIEEATKDKYPIYVASTGSCFIKKVSNRTGKEYRVYLGPEISQEICKELGIEYKVKPKSGQ